MHRPMTLAMRVLRRVMQPCLDNINTHLYLAVDVR
jgi:hypothetical protein